MLQPLVTLFFAYFLGVTALRSQANLLTDLGTLVVAIFGLVFLVTGDYMKLGLPPANPENGLMKE